MFMKYKCIEFDRMDVERSCVVELDGSSLEEVRVEWLMSEYGLELNEVLEESFDLKYFNSIKTLSLVGIVASSKINGSDLEIVQALSRKSGIKMLHIKIMSQLWVAIKKILPGSLRWRSMAKAPYLW